jgi:hypothetical protein
LAAGLSDLLAGRSSATRPSDSTSRERGIGIDGVTTAGGEASFLFLFLFFFSAAFTAKIAAGTAEADFFPTVDLVLRRDFMTPPASRSVTASASVSLLASTDESDS